MTVDRYEVSGSEPGCAVTHGIADTEFVDLLLADDEWVRREFDALVAAGWDGAVPTGPEASQGARWPRRPGYDHRFRPAPRPAKTRVANLRGHTRVAHRATGDRTRA